MKKDEQYIVDLCDEALGRNGLRQHLFDFLRGDTGRRLPVDVYYPDLALVIEYHERQHSEKVPHFDRRQTVSGVSRGIQRRMYDERRRDLLPKHGIDLIELPFSEFDHDSNGRLRRSSDNMAVVKAMLRRWMTASPTPRSPREACAKASRVDVESQEVKASVRVISEFIQDALRSRGESFVSAVVAARWLDQAGLLKDRRDRPGAPLRILLRRNQIAAARQENGRLWFIDAVRR